MKIMVVGPFGSIHRENAIVRGFRETGNEVYECSYGDILFDRNILSRVQFKIGFGIVYLRILLRLKKAVKDKKPDVIFFRRPLEFSPYMIKNIRKITAAKLVSYNNDDLFSSKYKSRRWVLLRKSIPFYDLHFAFRRKNYSELLANGAKKVEMWEPYYLPWLHSPANTDVFDPNRILFAMHSEKDQRREAVIRLTDAGFDVQVFSWNWHILFGKEDAEKYAVKQPIWGEDYVSKIRKSAATLCIFSKQNNDELTSRVFEIPASGGILVAERNPRLEELFCDMQDAVFFSGMDELVEKMLYLKNNIDVIRTIRSNSAKRIKYLRASIFNRCEDATLLFQQLLK